MQYSVVLCKRLKCRLTVLPFTMMLEFVINNKHTLSWLRQEEAKGDSWCEPNSQFNNKKAEG